MNVLFLNFDGVINIAKFDENGELYMNYPGKDTEVNCPEAVKLISNFCLANDFSIVVNSIWRLYSEWRNILYNSGLDKRVKVIGKTPVKSDRNAEIEDFLSHHDIDKFFVIDNSCFDFSEKIVKNHLIFCHWELGFTENELKILEAKNNG